MSAITLNDLINNLKIYNSEEIDIVTKAYFFAEHYHQGQYRQSGEPYITHPLNVAYTLSLMHADRDTIIAGLLHDLLEDTKVTKEEIEHEFNPTIAKLVLGVTKISKQIIESKDERNYANTRKLIMGISSDVRIIIIKLADRLHNMRTLEYKTISKQIENARETMEIFVPIAHLIGAYELKTELEDISFYYLNPKEYDKYFKERKTIQDNSEMLTKELLIKMERLLKDRKVPFAIKVKIKNIYGIYKSCLNGASLMSIHDLLALEIMVETVRDCYKTLGLLHQNYHSIDYDFRDYISLPKANMYQSLHTSVIAPSNRVIQARIRTFEMDKIAKFGLIAYWDKLKGDAKDAMQLDLENKFPFFRELAEIDSDSTSNEDFVNQVKGKLFSDKVTVYNSNGESIELPLGTTALQYIYYTWGDIGNSLVGVMINNKTSSFDSILKNGDTIKVLTDALSFSDKSSVLIKK